MKRLLLLLIFVFGSLHVNSQNIIAIQSFENSGDNWLPLSFSTPPCSNNNSVWDFSTNLPGITPSNGNQFWGIRDLDGNCGNDVFESIVLQDIDLSSFNEVIFSFDYNAADFDNGEGLKYELFYDNVSQGEVMVVNGIRGSRDDTNGWKTEIVSIPNSVTNIRVDLSAKCNQSNDIAGFDNVKLFNIPNDSCAGAEILNVFDSGTSIGNETVTNTLTATASDMPLTSCNEFTNSQSLDLFFSFTVPLGETNINVLTSGANGDALNLAVYDECYGNEIICQNNNAALHELTGLTSGASYILRVWHDEFNAGPFNIALETLPTPLTNDDCQNATPLIIGNSNTENLMLATNVGATDSGVLPNPSCASYNGNDIWYTAQVPASGILSIQTLNAGSNIDTGIAVYTGICSNLTEIACDDDRGYGLYSTINLNGYPNTTVYIRVWAFENGSSGNFNIVAYSPECPLTTSWNNSIWNNGSPNSYTTAIINSDYDTSINGSFEACDCQVNNNIKLNIRANNYISIHNDLVIDGTLELRHEGSLLMYKDDGQVSVNGILNVHKTTAPFNQFDFIYWSSPSLNKTIESALTTSVANKIYKFDTSIYNELTTSGWTPVGGSTIMTPGVGYIAMGPTDGTFPQTQDVVFEGPVNNGIIQTPIRLSADDTKDNEDWNLIGNPYPSGIDADLLLGDSLNRDVVGGSIYLWTHNTARNTNPGEQDYNSGDYATYTFGTGGVAATSGGQRPKGIIASGQSFFIEGASNGNITFNNSMRVNSGNDQFFRAPASKNSKNEQDKIWLNLTTDYGAFNQLLIGFINGATDGIDRSYDAHKFGGGWVSFYSIADGEHLAVQGRKALNEKESVKLGFSSYVNETEILKIGIDKLEGKFKESEYEIYLKDKFLNKIHDLNQQDYEFINESKGIYNDRFELVIQKSAILHVEEDVLNNQLIIKKSEGQLRVSTSNNSIISNFQAYNLLGKLLIDKSPNKNFLISSTNNISEGTILIIRTTLLSGEVLTKKIILH